MSEVMLGLRNALGEEARVEIYERILKLHEKIAVSERLSLAALNKAAFEMMTLSILEGLRISLRQMARLSADLHGYADEEYKDRERFVRVVTDLLKTGMITQHECETALKEPRDSSLPWILSSLEEEAQDLLSLLIIGHPGTVEEKVKRRELDCLMADSGMA